jgi:hypothetical protein
MSIGSGGSLTLAGRSGSSQAAAPFFIMLFRRFIRLIFYLFFLKLIVSFSALSFLLTTRLFYN